MIFVTDVELQTSNSTPDWDVFSTTRDLRQAILRLEESQRVVYCLVYFEHLTLDEVALVVEKPEDEVAALFYWAHVNLGVIPSPTENARGA